MTPPPGALKWLDRSHLMNYFDHGKAKSALFWAAMTYVVGALSSLAMLLYYVFIFPERPRQGIIPRRTAEETSPGRSIRNCPGRLAFTSA